MLIGSSADNMPGEYRRYAKSYIRRRGYVLSITLFDPAGSQIIRWGS